MPGRMSPELSEAAQEGDWGLVNELVANDPSFDQTAMDAKGMLLPHYAAMQNEVAVLRVMKERGLDLRVKNFKNRTPLKHAEAIQAAIERAKLRRQHRREAAREAAGGEGTSLERTVGDGHGDGGDGEEEEETPTCQDAIDFLLENAYTPAERLYGKSADFDMLKEEWEKLGDEEACKQIAMSEIMAFGPTYLNHCVKENRFAEVQFMADRGADLLSLDRDGVNVFAHLDLDEFVLRDGEDWEDCEEADEEILLDEETAEDTAGGGDLERARREASDGLVLVLLRDSQKLGVNLATVTDSRGESLAFRAATWSLTGAGVLQFLHTPTEEGGGGLDPNARNSKGKTALEVLEQTVLEEGEDSSSEEEDEEGESDNGWDEEPPM
uniref:Uncharacterized protein n=1 Tax=Chromera velia CCMP2878 TaxID=1169474 RepID=A0A0G4FD70_9ALVE|eukprot:Cvel_16425.t1-p1 / transcript=Cvel_16425.t1 / gene=Cvel_16425 / organism=Chromera_velia_CCMP2878 / gene_product=hypothetical protein / transcript_product=hypothetical protein / location=Cvel_scaffold1265:16900-21887(-) / protein_length=381 / sequence_SO=supercontig / SO=protein_coding / is_pseudo=false